MARPQGTLSGKYRDESGKAIGVFEWRQAHRKYSRKDNISQDLSLLQILSKALQEPQHKIFQDALELYIKNLKNQAYNKPKA